MTIHFPSRAEKTLAGVRASLTAMESNAYDPEELARRVDKLAGQLVRAAGDLRRTAKQQKKSGAGGAPCTTRGSNQGDPEDASG